MILTVQNPLVTPDFALRDTIIVLAGVVVGGMNRLLSATLGGFAIGFVSGLLGGALPTDQSQYLPSFVFGLVILVLLIRPAGLFARGAAPRWSGYEVAQRDPARRAGRARRRSRRCSARSLDRRPRSTSSTRSSRSTIVVALYVFVGNSGVALVRPHQLRRRRRLGGRRALACRSTRSRRSCRTCSRSCATTRSATSRRSLIAAGVGGRLRAARRPAADAALRASRRASRRSACSRSRTTSCATTRRSARARTRSRRCPRRPTCCRRRSARCS